MVVVTKTINIFSQGELDMLDITEKTQKAIEDCDIISGIVTVFVSGSTAGLTTIEYEPGLLDDFPKMLQRIAPKELEYGHEKMWHDGNGHSHVRASLLGPSITIPFKNKKLLLGTWQQIVLVECDTKKRERNIIVQIIGD